MDADATTKGAEKTQPKAKAAKKPRKQAKAARAGAEAGSPEATRDRAVGLLQEYIRIDTTNPPGSEGPAADFLASALKQGGVKAKIFKSPGGRPNLVARIPGRQGRALALMHHMDVVPCNPDNWTADPFGGELRDGAVWGRGTLDMKGFGIIHLMALFELAASVERGGEPERDLVYIAVSDEEEGGHDGARWLVSEHGAEVECEELITEGSFGIRDALPGVNAFPCAMTEKSVLWLRLTAKGDPGHGGTPPEDQAILNLLALLGELRKSNRQYRMGPTVSRLYRTLSASAPAPMRAALRVASGPAGGPVLAMLARKLGGAQRALLADLVSVTQLSAGYKANVIPGTAEATVDCRLLPDTSIDEFLAGVRERAALRGISVEVLNRDSAHGVSREGPAYDALRCACQADSPEALFTPSVCPGFTDSRFWREKGTSCLGLTPALLTTEELSGIHGNDERMPVDEMMRAIKITSRVVEEVCAPGSPPEVREDS